jgi:hypothetical protein
VGRGGKRERLYFATTSAAGRKHRRHDSKRWLRHLWRVAFGRPRHASLADGGGSKAYGMTDGPVYRDSKDPNIVLVHLEVEDMKRAMEWFRSDTLKEASKRSGKVRREIWTAERPAMPASATGATSDATLGSG